MRTYSFFPFACLWQRITDQTRIVSRYAAWRYNHERKKTIKLLETYSKIKLVDNGGILPCCVLGLQTKKELRKTDIHAVSQYMFFNNHVSVFQVDLLESGRLYYNIRLIFIRHRGVGPQGLWRHGMYRH